MIVENISLEQKTLFSLLAHNLFSVPLELDSNVDWKGVAKEAKVQSVFGVAFSNYKELPLEQELESKVKAVLMKGTLANVACIKNHTYLHELMTENNIPYCAVKGAVSASFYPEMLGRTMGDVDFYVHQSDLEKALRIFEKEGFARDKSNHPSHIALRNGNQHFEMHFNPVAYREGWVGDMLKEYWSNIREKAVIYESRLATFYGPSLFHHGLILLTHLQHHLFREGVGLRHFCDWALFAASLSNEEFLTIFEQPLKKIGLFRLAQLLSLGAVKYIGMPYQEWMGDDYETAEELLGDILYGGNFGRKDRRRAYEGMLIKDRATGNEKKGRLSRLIASLNEMVGYRWKIAKKIPLLYPVGWVYFTIRYLIRVIAGKRKMNLIDNYLKSEKRNQKYEKIKAFEPEE